MTFDELSSCFGSVLAEKVRRALPLDLFAAMDADELAPYLMLAAARAHNVYVARKSGSLPAASPAESHDKLCVILKQRWQAAQALADQVALAVGRSDGTYGTNRTYGTYG